MSMSNRADFIMTPPVYSGANGIAVLRTETAADAWQLFDPFASDLWLAALGATFLTAFLMVSKRGWCPCRHPA